jgi:hypothetical protein
MARDSNFYVTVMLTYTLLSTSMSEHVCLCMSMLLREALARAWACMCRLLTSCRNHFVCHTLLAETYFGAIMHVDVNSPLYVT